MNSVPVGGGILPVDKPEGPTSHDIVSRARKLLRERRIGHMGTLDPFASGLLMLCVGPATRLMQYLVGADKEYVARARLGVTTDTLDREGEVTGTSDAWEGLDREAVEAALESFRGEIVQTPPVFSAKKIRGEAAHRRVRRGESVELEPVTVTVHHLELTGLDLPEVDFRVRCSSGTYIRALARDLGEALGVGAHLTGLRRTRVGHWHVDEAVDGDFPDGIPDAAWVAPLDAMEGWTRLALEDDDARRLAQGQRVPSPDAPPGPAVAHWHGTLLAICEVKDGVIHPRRVFPPPREDS